MDYFMLYREPEKDDANSNEKSPNVQMEQALMTTRHSTMFLHHFEERYPHFSMIIEIDICALYMAISWYSYLWTTTIMATMQSLKEMSIFYTGCNVLHCWSVLVLIVLILVIPLTDLMHTCNTNLNRWPHNNRVKLKSIYILFEHIVWTHIKPSSAAKPRLAVVNFQMWVFSGFLK